MKVSGPKSAKVGAPKPTKQQPLSKLLATSTDSPNSRGVWFNGPTNSALRIAALSSGNNKVGGSILPAVPIPAARPKTESPALTSSPSVSPIQRGEMQQLCSAHGIHLDPESLEVLKACQVGAGTRSSHIFEQTPGEMSNLLRDNMTQTNGTKVDAFVEEFWDLVRNPFKPVKKGIAAPKRPKKATGKGVPGAKKV